MKMPDTHVTAIGVLTSGGDAPGMNAALRAVVRTALNRGVAVYAIYEGYQGMVDGGDRIRPMTWDNVGGMMQRGGTIIGTARCAAFRTREGRLIAAKHLLERGIDRLVVIGGDGSLTGANLFRQEWTSLLEELVQTGAVPAPLAQQHAYLSIVGLVGSIDNDFYGTDMTIGADTALHRITTALDQISSTAISHQRSFVVEVMGRNCGYLALMSALAGGADYAFFPEHPPSVDDWETQMCDLLKAGRAAGRRDLTVIVAEGARDKNGNPITAERVRQVLADRLHEDVRSTILGHVQRGGAPSAFDRWMSTLVGSAAVDELLAAGPDSEPQMIGMRYNRIRRHSLMECVNQTREVPKAIAAQDYERAMELRGNSFNEAHRTFRTLSRALPHPPAPDQRPLRLAILTAGASAPGMNTAVHAAARLAIDQGHVVLGVHNGFRGLVEDEIEQFDWMSVHGWGSMGGSQLGTSRATPTTADMEVIARTLRRRRVDGLLVIGGWSAYEAAQRLHAARDEYEALSIPIICMPAAIDNNLPGTEISIGADTALNNIVDIVDKIKQSAVATRRCFVVEVMGRQCGYLALMSSIATGAERAYLPEEGITLHDLEIDLVHMKEGFRRGQRKSVMIRNERANPLYTASFMAALFEQESEGLFDVRQAILGHVQQGGDPSPFDRIQATRLAARCVTHLIEAIGKDEASGGVIGLVNGHVEIHDLDTLAEGADLVHMRPIEQWWLELRPIARLMTHLSSSAPKGKDGA
jgi:6-phosphofructokinase 1